MGIPIVSEMKNLSQPPRRFLAFSALNALSWFSLVGPVMVLFGRKIEMPASWIGFLLSFMPLSTLLVMVAIPLVTRMGPKRLMIATWVGRNAMASMVFLVPWAFHTYGPRTAWIVLLAAILSFCVVRALGVGGWFPWLHEVVPDGEQSTFFSTETALAQCCIVAVTLSQALILGPDPGMGRFLLINGFGIAIGFMSAVWLARVPGGHSTYDPEFPESSFFSYAVAWADRSYVTFVATTALCFSCFAWINASIVLYMRDILGYADLRIMLLMASGNLGVLLTIHYWGRFADHSGTGKAILLAMIGHSAGALTYLMLPPGAPWTAWLLPPTIVATTLLGAANWTISHRYMIGIVNEKHKVGYTNFWILGTAISMGVTPIIAGYVIEHFGMAGFQLAFSVAGFGGIVAGLANYWVVHHRQPLRHALDDLINPTLPVRTLARIAWVTVGLHSSNRKHEQANRGG